MFYVLKKEKVADVEERERIMVLADFSGVPAGTIGVITENYRTGVMVTWAKDGKTIEDIYAALDMKETTGNEFELSAARGFVMDGFGEDELEYLAFGTLKHPKNL